MNLLLVMLGGALGAGARHLLGQALLGWLGPSFPWWTLGINVTGGLFMGVLAGLLLRFGINDQWRLLLGVGVLGGYTTFSSFSLDAVTLWERGAMGSAVGYVTVSVIGSIAMLVVGLWLARPGA